MQKKLIALAIAGLSGAAFAQSNVTIYGVADATYDFINVSGGATTGNNVSYNRVSTNSSLIGFKGVEALGNGLAVAWQYESGIAFDSQGALGATRDSYVGLAGGFGTVAMGNLTGPTRALGASLDVNAGATGIGSNSALIGKLANLLTGGLNTAMTGVTLNQVVAPATVDGTGTTRSATQASAYDTRFKNAIAYISPNMGGFTFVFGYVPNEGRVNTAGASADPKAYDMGLTYANGPVTVGFTHADVKLNNTGSAATALLGGTAAGNLDNAHTQNTRLGGSYNFGAATVRAMYDKTKLDVNAVKNINQTVWGLGATFNVGSGDIIAQYYKAKDLDVGGTQNGTGAKLTEIGYQYNLSKRSMIKAVYSRLSNDTNAAYDYGVNSTGVASNGAALSGVQIGLRHSF